jgi:hypothetical protein
VQTGFDPLAYARTDLAPLLRSLCELTEDEEENAQHGFFSRILHAIEAGDDSGDLAGAFMELSTAAFLGFRYSPTVAMVLDRALEKAQLLAQSLALDWATCGWWPTRCRPS